MRLVVTASGDKLLGGPQAGLICGRHDVIARLKKHPMARALRLDKMTLAALEATLFACLDETRALREIPTLRMLTTPVAEVRTRAEALAVRMRDALGDRPQVVCIDEIARAGGGSLPLAEIATVAVAVAPATVSVAELEERLRTRGEPAIVARVKDGRLLIDPRTLLSPAEEDVVVARLGEVLGTRVSAVRSRRGSGCGGNLDIDVGLARRPRPAHRPSPSRTDAAGPARAPSC